MINVKIRRWKNQSVSSVTVTGHADFAPNGQDLVCAGASAVIFGSLNAIVELTGYPIKVKQAGSEGGFLEIKFSDEHPNFEQAQLLLQGMIISLKTIEHDYGKYIRVNDKISM